MHEALRAVEMDSLAMRLEMAAVVVVVVVVGGVVVVVVDRMRRGPYGRSRRLKPGEVEPPPPLRLRALGRRAVVDVVEVVEVVDVEVVVDVVVVVGRGSPTRRRRRRPRGRPPRPRESLDGPTRREVGGVPRGVAPVGNLGDVGPGRGDGDGDGGGRGRRETGALGARGRRTRRGGPRRGGRRRRRGGRRGRGRRRGPKMAPRMGWGSLKPNVTSSVWWHDLDL